MLGWGQHLHKCTITGEWLSARIRTRRVVECAFGRLKGRFRLLYDTRLRSPGLAARVTRVCCALHNYLERRLGREVDLPMLEVEPSDLNAVNYEPGVQGAAGQKRLLLASYAQHVLKLAPVRYTQAQMAEMVHGPLGFSD